MGGIASKSGRSSQLPGSRTAAKVDPDEASSSNHQSSGSRDNSNSSNNLIVLQMKSYEKACKEIPEIQSFDDILRVRAKETISDIASDANKKAISLASLRKAADYVFDAEADAVRRILESNENICKHPELKALVEDYFDSSAKTLKFCLDLKNCVMNTRNKQMLSIKLAVKRFEEEEEEMMDGATQSSDGKGLDRFRKTMEELKRFTELEEPFTVEFLQVFQSVRDQQTLMLDKLTYRRKNLAKKLKRMKSWKKVSGIIFASTFAVALICSVVAAALSAPAAVVAVAGAATTAFGPLGKWFQSLWKSCEEPLRSEVDLVTTMQEETYTIIEELKMIVILVDRLGNDYELILGTAKFALRDDGAVRIGIEVIRKKLCEFEEWLDLLEDRAETCGKVVREARAAVFQKVRTNHE